MEVTHVGWRVEGVVYGRAWDGFEGEIDMKPFSVDKPTREAMLAGINDHGFGLESILFAECDLIETFTLGASQYHHTEYFERGELVNAKRGI